MIYKVRTSFNFILGMEDCETPVGESMTVPDETMSIQELLERFMNGQRVPDNLFREGGFDSGSSFDSDDLEKVRDLDLVERGEVAAGRRVELKRKQKVFDREQNHVVVSSKKKVDKDLSVVSRISKKVKRKGAAGPARDQGAKRPSKGDDEGSE